MRDPIRLRGLYKEHTYALKNWYEALEKAIAGDALARTQMRDYTKELDQVHQQMMEEARHFVRWPAGQEASTTPKTDAALCEACQQALDQHVAPEHLVHPTNRTVGIFDVRGMAVCPTCSAQWHRLYNTVELVR